MYSIGTKQSSLTTIHSFVILKLIFTLYIIAFYPYKRVYPLPEIKKKNYFSLKKGLNKIRKCSISVY